MLLTTTNAFKKGFLALGLLVLAGCQTSPENRPTHPEDAPRISLTQAERILGTEPDRGRVRRALAEIETTPTLWSRIRKGFKLDPAVIDNPRIDQQRLVYTSQPRYFESTSARSQLYLHYVVEQIDARGLPQELALLPFVESSYNPMAYSSSHAAGLWQFIPSTGKIFSLRQDWWYDGRRDVTASTQAALDYLTSLNETFDGDWLLALAAYNCGPGCVGRAIKRNRERGLPTDYWNLQLPRETMNYVPKLLAMAQVIESPTAYGASLPKLKDEPYFTEVTVEQQLDLHKAAELASITPEELLSLNPAFKQRVTAPEGPFQLLVPVVTADQFVAGLAELPASEYVSFHRYNVRRGDTLSQIADRYQLSVNAIKQANDMVSGNTIRVGQTLMLPTTAEGMTAPASARSLAMAEPLTYQVKPGDNLWAIAKRHGVSVNAITRDNGLSTPVLRVGQQLQLASADTDASAGGRKVVYTVKPGDSLYSIAREFKVRIDHIRDWNELGSVLRPGQQLTLHLL
ncbi:LysM peptidoglycan-binding domain-containing protein [Pseudomonas sp. gcc21]|uniref:LysM peptidoglycan-binding domain-containing protein n=1 Tax=Pseudomonas sp. gcc21 TaxID=2726989 RepID=UPI0014520434|nr:LysM peptidoglycan-binding domain-containing protein [Pseudomonas sp. gcc21]QJD58549.1 LysM peptidoglycan-binding domain-containing protein [Pseudomonas sp. gcc21]